MHEIVINLHMHTRYSDGTGTHKDIAEAAIKTGFIPSLSAVTTCKVPKSAFADVSLPVRKTPNQPSIALKNGNKIPVAANASPRVAVAPE